MSTPEIKLEELKTLTKVHVLPELSATSVQALYNALQQAIELNKPIKIDARKLQHIDSTCVQTLIAAKYKAEQENLKIEMSEPPHHITEIFTLLGLQKELSDLVQN